MKIQARDLKVGQDVNFKYWMKIEKLVYGVQKNGKEYVNVQGTVYECVVKSRKYGTRFVESHWREYDCPKLDTWVSVR